MTTLKNATPNFAASCAAGDCDKVMYTYAMFTANTMIAFETKMISKRVMISSLSQLEIFESAAEDMLDDADDES